MKHILFLVSALFSMVFSSQALADYPVPAAELQAIEKKYKEAEKANSVRIADQPKAIDAYSRRGDARLFLGDFKGSAEDYEMMIELDSALDVSHWRLGIAYYYLNRFDKAAHQFEIYHNHDNVDRENGIWRFMSQTRLKNMEVARKGLLKYEKTDRPPYPWVYSLYAGDIKPEDVYQKIDEGGFPDRYKERVLFHAQLYVGIFHELNGRDQDALKHLRTAAANEYGRATGTYMWQVARVHYDLLQAKLASKNRKK
jgi:lipoprotein NlpI